MCLTQPTEIEKFLVVLTVSDRRDGVWSESSLLSIIICVELWYGGAGMQVTKKKCGHLVVGRGIALGSC